MTEYVKRTGCAFEPGSPFRCYCSCHRPSGCVLYPGQAAPPAMRPCDDCKEIHP